MIGSNVPQIGGFKTGFKYGDLWKCDCIQMYITPSRRWDIKELVDDEIHSFKKLWRESNVIEVVAHIPFLVNLATTNKEHLERSINRVIAEIKRASSLGIKNLVIHPGSSINTTREKGLNQIIKSLNYIFSTIRIKDNVNLCLETMAGQGNTLCSSFNEIISIFENIEYPKFLGVCFDVAHVFISGYDIRGYDGYERILNEFDEIIGINNIRVIHLNDSKTGLGSKNDRHDNIGKGKIGLQTFHSFVRDKRFKTTPKIIEIPKRDEMSEENLNLLRELQKIETPLTICSQFDEQKSLIDYL